MNQLLQKQWVRWLLVLLGLAGIGIATSFVLRARELTGTAKLLDWSFLGLACAWGYFGLWKCRTELWAKWGAGYLTASIVLWVIAAVFLIYEYPQNSLRVVGFWAIAAITIGGIQLARLVVSYPHPTFAVARTVLDQANRMHIVKITALIVVLVVVFLPTWPDVNERLDYRIRFYLIWALRIATVFLSLLTVLLGCYTVATDFKQRQIFMLASKPVGRFSYIAGKWVGLVMLDAVLLVVVGLGIWIGAHVMYEENANTPEKVDHKKTAARDVLTARRMALPQMPEDMNQGELIRSHLERLRSEVPNPEALPEDAADLPRDVLLQINGRIIAEWHKLNPLETKRYVFHGLNVIADQYRPFIEEMRRLRERHAELMAANRVEEARAVIKEASTMTFPLTSLRLRLKPKYSRNAPDNKVRMAMEVGGRGKVALLPMPNDTIREIELDRFIGLIDDEGRLVVSLQHINGRNPKSTFKGTIIMKPEEGLSLFYTAGSFEGNVTRSMAILWIRLAFLCMLSIAAAIFVSFPVAVLASLVAYGVASTSQFASESLDSYVALKLESPSAWDQIVGMVSAIWTNLIDGSFGEVLKLFMSLIGKTVLLIMPSFNHYSPTELLADGLFVPYGLVGESLLYVGGLSTGVCCLFAWLVFRRKELAKVMV